MRRFALLVAGLGLLAGVATAVSGGATQVEARWGYRVLPGRTATAINDSGQIALQAEPSAVLWQNGKKRDLGTLGGYGIIAWDINERGQVVGRSDKSGGSWHAFLWESGAMRDLGTMPGSGSTQATAINERGQVIGTLRGRGGRYRAFLWEQGRMLDLGTLGGKEAGASAINNRGQIVGSSLTKAKDMEGYPIEHAFLWEDGKMRDLGTLPGAASSEALDINERGQVLGEADMTDEDGDPITHAFLWQDGTMRDLGTLGGARTSAFAINNSGQIVGWSEIADSKQTNGNWLHVFLWQKGRMRDLAPAGNMYSRSEPINDRGHVVSATLGNRPFIWRKGAMTALPIPPDSECLTRGINERDQVIGECWRSGHATRTYAVLWTLKRG